MLHTHHIAFESFWVSGVLIFAALLYLRGWLRIRRSNLESVEGWRAASFVFGLLLIWIATASPFAALDHAMLTAHMVQHLLLMTFAAPLILLGVPVKAPVHEPLQTIGHLLLRHDGQDARSIGSARCSGPQSPHRRASTPTRDAVGCLICSSR